MQEKTQNKKKRRKKREKDKDRKKKIQDIMNKAIPLLNNPKPAEAGILNDYLFKFDRELKSAMNKYGLLMPSKDDPRFAVLQR